MRVAVITPVYPPYRGGMGSVAARDVEYLRNRGLEVEVITPSLSGGRPLFRLGNAAFWPQLLWRIREFDVAHLHYPFYGADIFVALACLLRHIPLVITYHMVPEARDYRQVIFLAQRIFVEPLILKIAACVLVSSLDYARARHIVHPHLVELPLGVEVERFKPGTASVVRDRLNIPEDGKIILFVGGLDTAHFFKGVDVLLQAVWQLRSQIPWRLVIVGEGDRRHEYEQLASALGIADRVSFIGNVSNEELPAIYRAADIHVLPSTGMNEAFGLVTLEAAASGVPSIVSDLPGVRSVVVASETGCVVPARDPDALASALERLLGDDHLRRQMGQAARSRVLANYNQKQLAERLIPLYNSLIRV